MSNAVALYAKDNCLNEIEQKTYTGRNHSKVWKDFL